MEAEVKYLFKIILIGNSGVGKTSLMKRYTDETYNFSQASTIGVDFKIKTLELDGEKIKLQIWDTAGQERFRAIISNYYRGAHGIIIVFDMGNRDSFSNLTDWIGEVRKHTNENVEIIILGNKVDDEEKITVTEADINGFLEANGLDNTAFYKTSAKNDVCVTESFEHLTKKLVEKYKRIGFGKSKKESFILNTEENRSQKCCM